MCVCLSVCACVCVLRIVSREKILHFTNTFIIIIIIKVNDSREIQGQMQSLVTALDCASFGFQDKSKCSCSMPLFLLIQQLTKAAIINRDCI